jgi:C4-dicarboxylate-specific signal transduction histidine kinase
MDAPAIRSFPHSHALDPIIVSAGTDSENAKDATAAKPQELIEQLMTIARVSALEEMASGIAHELNQPLGAIATFSQAAERMLRRPEPMTSATLEVLQHINREAMNAGEGIRRIRKLFNQAGADRQLCSMQEMVTELQPVLNLLASRFHAVLDVKFDQPLPLIAADRLRIQHVLLTLVQNALEAPIRTGASNRVLVEVTSDRYTVQVSVVDQGTGISEQQKLQIFKPFFTTKSSGTGLGLASSRAIIEAHEGTIGFKDLDSGGTQFWFRLPAVSGGASG